MYLSTPKICRIKYFCYCTFVLNLADLLIYKDLSYCLRTHLMWFSFALSVDPFLFRFISLSNANPLRHNHFLLWIKYSYTIRINDLMNTGCWGLLLDILDLLLTLWIIIIEWFKDNYFKEGKLKQGNLGFKLVIGSLGHEDVHIFFQFEIHFFFFFLTKDDHT